MANSKFLVFFDEAIKETEQGWAWNSELGSSSCSSILHGCPYTNHMAWNFP